MLGDISKAEHIYIACGYTDMRKAIDGLSAIVQNNFHLVPFLTLSFYSVGENVTVLKSCTRKVDLFCYIKGLKMGSSSGPETNPKYVR